MSLVIGLTKYFLTDMIAADENIEVVRQIPLERLQIETDGPWVSTFPFLKHRD